MSRYDYGGWAPYVPVAARRAKAVKQMDKLRKKGVVIQPIEITGRIIARSFWGKGWCDHLDSFGDYSNRLPRGRTYVRNGSVCHLDIRKGEVEAIVSGSSLYTINIKITPLTSAKWGELKRQCTGKIGSLLELLQGRLSDDIMGVVTDKKNGLFPLPGEIKMDCNCPDYAGMCKHIAAVVYGVGARLDSRPELLFLLRGVNHEELIDADTAQITGGKSQRDRRRSIASEALEDVFGVELEGATEVSPARRPQASKKTLKKTLKKTVKKVVKKVVKKEAKGVIGIKKAALAKKVTTKVAKKRGLKSVRNSKL